MSEELETHTKRPVIVTILVLFSFVALLILSLFNLLIVVNSKWILEVNDNYQFSNESVQSLLPGHQAINLLFHLTSIVGLWFLFRMRKRGFVIFSASTLLLASYQLLTKTGSPFETFTFIFMILAFGLFYRKLN